MLERQSVLSRIEDPCYDNIIGLRKSQVGGILLFEFNYPQEALIIVDPYGKSSLYSMSKSDPSSCPTLSLVREYDPRSTAPGNNLQNYQIPTDYYKRSQLCSWKIAADIGAYNPDFHTGYEIMVLISDQETSEQIIRVRYLIPDDKLCGLTREDGLYHDSDGSAYIDYFHNTTPEMFYLTLHSTCILYQYFDNNMIIISIPDTWLLHTVNIALRYVQRNINCYFNPNSSGCSGLSDLSDSLEKVKYSITLAQNLWIKDKVDFSSYKRFMTTILISQIHDIMIDRTQKLLLTEFRNIFLSTESESCFQPGLEYLLDKLPVLKRIVDGIILKYNQSKQSHPPKSWLYGIIMEETVPPYISDYRTKDTLYSIYDHAVEAWWAVSEYAMSLAMISQRFMDSKLEDRSRELFLVAQEMYKSLTWSLSQSQCSLCTSSPSQEGMCRYHAVIEKYDQNPDLYLECSIFNRTHISEYSRNRLASGVQKHDDISNILSSDYCPVKENPRRQRDTYINMLEHLINQDDYRPFLYALYYQSCNEVDPWTGNIYAEIQRLTDETQTTVQSSWCNIIERALRPTIGLRWMLCYEEQDRDVCHLQKGCPESWFSEGQEIRVENCPTRFGTIGWRTKCVFRSMWFIELEFYKKQFLGKLIIHIHPPDGTKLYVSSVGRIVGNTIEIDQDVIFQYRSLYISVNEGEVEDE